MVILPEFAVCPPSRKQGNHLVSTHDTCDSRIKLPETNQQLLVSFIAYVNEICPLNEEALTELLAQTEIIYCKKGQSPAGSGQAKDNFFFIQKGVIRAYTKTAGGEITMWLNSDNELAGSIPALGIVLPFDQEMQALEDSTLIRIPQSFLEYLFEHFPGANLLGRALFDDHYRCLRNKSYGRRNCSAEEKYNRFCETQGSLLERVDAKFIASFLGMSVITFNRLVYGTSVVKPLYYSR